MRKFLPLILFTFISYLAYSNATVTQNQWRWRKDNGTETSATWMSNEVQGAGLCNMTDTIRLRIGFQVDPDPFYPEETASHWTDSRIAYSTSPNGPFTMVPFSANLAGEAFVFTTSSFVSNGQQTNQQLSSTGGFYFPGQIVADNANPEIIFSTPSYTITETEYEWVIKPTANAALTTYYFRLEGLHMYSTTYPQLTLVSYTVAGSTSITNVTCKGLSNGAINLTPSGGVEPYSFVWGGNITTEDRTGLAAGDYSVNISDANGCTAVVQESITEPSAVIASITSVTNVSCFGGTNGSATASAVGGTGNLTYAWTPAGGTTATASGLSAGSYKITVTDANNCIDEEPVEITEPTAITATVEQELTDCSVTSNESATVTASGGTGTLQYLWTPSAQTTATAVDLVPGDYTVSVTDDNQCQIIKELVVVDQVCTGLDKQLSAEISIYPNPLNEQGMVSVRTLQNIKVEQVSLMDAHGRKVLTTENQTSFMIQNLDAGMYIVEIVTDKGVAVKRLMIK